jgi:hypothetical protein
MKFSSRCWKRFSVMVCGFLIVSLCGSALMAKPGVVKTRDGRSIEGDVTDQGDTVTITVHGIPTSVPKENVESIQYTGTIDEQYQQKLADLPKNAGASDHLDLARWLLDNHAYNLALREVSAAQHLDPNNSDAATLEQTIESQMRLDRAHKTAPTTPPPSGGTSTTPATPPTGTGVSGHTASLHRYLSMDNIFSLRLAEWPADDASVKISFTNDVRRKYIASAQENAAQFMGQSPVDQARAILDNGSPEQRKDVKLLTDPVPLATFKRNIQPIILTGCATAACHGGPTGGKFFLYGNPDSEAATYTNYYLLVKGSTETGGATRLMIDRDYPDKSLLAMWGLPSDISKSAHPDVKGVTWRPLFRNTQDPQYRALISWVGSLTKPAPHYDFTFSIDTPATAPAKGSR